MENTLRATEELIYPSFALTEAILQVPNACNRPPPKAVTRGSASAAAFYVSNALRGPIPADLILSSC